MALDRLRLTPHRPALPPLLLGGLGLWLGVVCLYPLTRSVSLATLSALFWIAAALTVGTALTLLCVLRGRRHARWSTPILFALLMAALCGVSVTAAAIRNESATAALPGGSATYTFELVTDAQPSTFGNRVEALASDGQSLPVRVELLAPGDYHDLTLGTRLVATVHLSPPTETNAAYYWQNGLIARATSDSYDREAPSGPLGALFSFRTQAIDALRAYGGNAAPLMEALACGYRPDLEESGLYTAFQRTGLAHLVAVSGAHLTLVSMMLLSVLMALGAPRPVQIGAVIVFALIYWVLAGLPVSALRAAIMMITALTSFSAARRSFPLNAIGLCIIAFLVTAPTAAFSVSFGLSVGSTLGIVLFTPLMLGWFSTLGNRVRDLVISPLALTVASSIMTQPASVAIFHQLPLIAPLANIVATPLFTVACVASLLAALGGGLVPAVGSVIVGAAALATMPLLLVVDALAQIPWACMAADGSLPVAVGGSAAMAFGLWFWWPVEARRTVALIAGGAAVAAIAFFWMTAHPAADEIIMLDIGQGDSFVLRSQGATVMVDTGQRDSDLKAALGRHGITHLDALFITHGDADHCGSMDALGQVCTVDAVLLAKDALTCPCDACVDLVRDARALVPDGVSGLAVGDEITVGRFRLSVISPEHFVDEGGNGDSLTFVAEADEDGDGEREWSALFSGDAEADVLQSLVDEHMLGPVDILKVAHHGSKAAVTDELLDELAPQVALVSVGANNRYGHPTDETLEALAAADVATWRSDESGDVVVTMDADSMSVTAQTEKSR